MSGHELLTSALLAVAVLICALSAIAILIMPGFYDKLHYLAPPAILATAAVVAALLLQEGLSPAGVKALLILAVLMVSNPLITHAAARSKSMRDRRRTEQQRNAEKTK